MSDENSVKASFLKAVGSAGAVVTSTMAVGLQKDNTGIVLAGHHLINVIGKALRKSGGLFSHLYKGPEGETVKENLKRTGVKRTLMEVGVWGVRGGLAALVGSSAITYAAIIVATTPLAWLLPVPEVFGKLGEKIEDSVVYSHAMSQSMTEEETKQEIKKSLGDLKKDSWELAVSVKDKAKSIKSRYV